MFRKWMFLLIIVILCLTPYSKKVASQVQLPDYQDENIHILLIYSNKSATVTPNVKILDMLLHHFSDDVDIVSDHEATAADFQEKTEVFYYGEHEQKLNNRLLSLLNNFSGSVIAIGENMEQIELFSQFKQVGEIEIKGVGLNSQNRDVSLLDYPITIKRIEEKDDIDTLVYGYKGPLHFPLVIRKRGEEHYYFSANQLDNIMTNYFAEILHYILPNNHPNEHVAYLRLEDIHPMSDPKKLLEVGTYLNERNIPYLLAVIPVNVIPDTGERVFFSDAPELVDVLHYLQNTGGTVIAHGYTHQYRDSDTGEGFEFWDLENEQFIISNEPNKKVEKIVSQEHFANKQEYIDYIDRLKEKEKSYIKTKLENSIHELASHDLYPLGFKAPHYSMSQQGYSITSTYFSTILGQVQLSDKKREIMNTSPFVTSGSFLNGMKLLPETIGFVDPSLEDPFLNIGKAIDKTFIVRDGVIGGFYHSYLGIEYLPEFLAEYEKIPNLTWLDLKETVQHVQTSDIQITTDGTGEIQVKNKLTWWQNITRQIQLTFLEKILWGMTIIVFIFVSIFFLFTIFLRTQLRKRLFRERKTVG